MSLAVGSRVGPYEVLGPLGAGGMGEVFRARDARLDRDVALKVLPASFSGDPERVRRFEQEARAAGALNHPNVLAVYDVGAHEGIAYLVSELLEGQTLRDRAARGRLPLRKCVDYAALAARGLAAAHDKGIVHRDLKPENLPLDAYRFTPRIAAATPLADGDEIAVGSARMAFRASAAGSTETAAG